MINEQDLHLFDTEKRGAIANAFNEAIQSIENKIQQCRISFPNANDDEFADVHKKINLVKSRLTKKQVQIAFIAPSQHGKSTLINRLFIPTPREGYALSDYYCKDQREFPELVALGGYVGKATTSCIVRYCYGSNPALSVEPFNLLQRRMKFQEVVEKCEEFYGAVASVSGYVPKLESDIQDPNGDASGRSEKIKIKQTILYGNPTTSADAAVQLNNTRMNGQNQDNPNCGPQHYQAAYSTQPLEIEFAQRTSLMNLSVSQNALSQLIYKISISGLGSSTHSSHYQQSDQSPSISPQVVLVDVPGYGADLCDQFLFKEYIERCDYPDADGYVILSRPAEPLGIDRTRLYQLIKRRATKFGIQRTKRVALCYGRFGEIYPQYRNKLFLDELKAKAESLGLEPNQVFLLDLANTGHESNSWAHVRLDEWQKLGQEMGNDTYAFFEEAFRQLYETGNGGVNRLREYINGDWIKSIAEEIRLECLHDINLANENCESVIRSIKLRLSLNVDQRQQIDFAKNRIGQVIDNLRTNCSHFQKLVQSKREEIYNLMEIYKKTAPRIGIESQELSDHFTNNVFKNLFQKSLMGILVPASYDGNENENCPVSEAWAYVSRELDVGSPIQLPVFGESGVIESKGLTELWNKRYNGLSSEGIRAVSMATDDPVLVFAKIWSPTFPLLSEMITSSWFLNQFKESANTNIEAFSNKIASGRDTFENRQVLYSLIFMVIDDIFSEAASVLQEFIIKNLKIMSSELITLK